MFVIMLTYFKTPRIPLKLKPKIDSLSQGMSNIKETVDMKSIKKVKLPRYFSRNMIWRLNSLRKMTQQVKVTE